jgi:hypothetical protein
MGNLPISLSDMTVADDSGPSCHFLAVGHVVPDVPRSRGSADQVL